MLRSVFAVVLLLALSAPAAAQWVYQSDGGEFDDDPLHLAVTAAGKYAFGLRCRKDSTEIVFLTPERISDDNIVEPMNALEPKLRVRIDKGEIRSFDASIDDADGKLAVIADVDVDFYESVRDAKSSVSVVLTSLGKNYHETKFNVRGSKAAIAKLIKGCALPAS
ncbi:hypothetical protein [Ancylobacter novellus]|uniref:hypothetical protein n=1 Tax=Ancylobacter novellus TaxID=921 RepID=UPI001185AB84|nr:hypothetical protein [Ancylobacter novellus]